MKGAAAEETSTETIDFAQSGRHGLESTGTTPASPMVALDTTLAPHQGSSFGITFDVLSQFGLPSPIEQSQQPGPLQGFVPPPIPLPPPYVDNTQLQSPTLMTSDGTSFAPMMMLAPPHVPFQPGSTITNPIGSPLSSSTFAPMPPFRYTLGSASVPREASQDSALVQQHFEQIMGLQAGSQLNSAMRYDGDQVATATTSTDDNAHSDAHVHWLPKPCDVWTCFNPTFCLLNACGCKLCREHLGSVIRGSRSTFSCGGEGEHDTGVHRKVFTCVACHTEAVRAVPAGSTVLEEGGGSHRDEKQDDVGADDKNFSVQYLYNPPVGYATSTSAVPELNTSYVMMSPSAYVASGSDDLLPTPPPPPSHVDPEWFANMSLVQQQQQEQQAQRQLSQQAGINYGQMYPFGAMHMPPTGYTMGRPLSFASPQQAFEAQQRHHQHFQSFQFQPMTFIPYNSTIAEEMPPQSYHQPLMIEPSPLTHVSRRQPRSRAFSSPSGLTSSQFVQDEHPQSPSRAESGTGPGSGISSTVNKSRAGERGHDRHHSIDYASMRTLRGDEGPAELYAVNRTPWPLVKVENIPFNTTVDELERWLPEDVFPNQEQVSHPVHLILHRRTGRTLPHCYLEIKNLGVASEIITQKDRKMLGDRTVRVKWERRGELMRDLFSQEGYFARPAPSPAAAPLPPVPTKYTLPEGIIKDADLNMLLDWCHRSKLPNKERPTERAFLNVASIIAKFPWAEPSLFTGHTRDAVFKCAFEAVKMCAAEIETDPGFETIFDKLFYVILGCEGFTLEQKKSVQNLKVTSFWKPDAFPTLQSSNNDKKAKSRAPKKQRVATPPLDRGLSTSPEPNVIQTSLSLPTTPPLTPTLTSKPETHFAPKKLGTSFSLSDVVMNRHKTPSSINGDLQTSRSQSPWMTATAPTSPKRPSSCE
ncbi:hypothetical protein OIO90_001430 [Microbotryomycetes sp. JL221]|nr:hypothetical protein OIO90_001430 [Microbotryomycetes sp. JL221]